MTTNPALHFEAYLRSLIHDEVKNALHATMIALPTVNPNRIGGINLAVEVTGMAKQTIYNLASKRLIPHAKRGGRIIFEEDKLRSWLVENKRPLWDTCQLITV